MRRTGELKPVAKRIDLEKLVMFISKDPEREFEVQDSEELLRLIVEQHTMTSGDVMERLMVSRQRLQGLKNQGYLNEIKIGLFSRSNVEAMRSKQIKEERIRDYELYPIFRKIEGCLIIDKLRFFDCQTMVRVESREEDYDPVSHPYKQALEELLTAVVETYKKKQNVVLLRHPGFEAVYDPEDLQIEVENGVWFVGEYKKDDFLKLLERVSEVESGLKKADNFQTTINELELL
ncbi:hypothetical protein [Paenibacillus agilis]|uniref:Uncharacterized protein n=1 Tax=Paenibacillus agilis TaxID=3020863 RepID=A0A559J072_9BACL|nr:hypothetical protein [Paenibacillus agilis]TVX93279.1 hypothetical protein FPZ44_09545 [Paenibacillus agilis]